MESLEHLHVVPPRRGGPTVDSHRTDNAIDVLGCDVPRRPAQGGQHPLQHTGVVVDRDRAEPRATHDSTFASTHRLEQPWICRCRQRLDSGLAG
jgi:hypothetical protein